MIIMDWLVISQINYLMMYDLYMVVGAKIEEKTTGGMGPPTLPRRAMRDRSKASYVSVLPWHFL